MPLRIGFIGLGLMGRPMAHRVARAGYPLTVFNRTRAKAEGLVSEGAAWVATPADLACRSDVVITMVTGPKDVAAVLFGPNGVAKGAARGTIVIDMSTIGMAAAQRIGARLSRRKMRFLDAPVTGSIPGAEQGTLAIMVGGDAETFAACRPLLETMGTPFHIGPVGMGSLLKLAQNLIAAATVEGLAEGLALAASHGLDPARAADVLGQTGVASTFLKMKAAQIVAGDYTPKFTLANMAKDLGLVVKEMRRGRLRLPAVRALAKIYREAMARGYAAQDYAILFEALTEGNSLAANTAAVYE